MDLGLNGKVALVTASSGGIGWSVARRLALEGARVAICGRDEDRLAAAQSRLEEEVPGSVLAVRADVTSPEQVTGLLARVTERFGGLDILVCNTGGPPTGTFMSTSPEDWEAALGLIFWPVIHLVRGAVPSMQQRGGGRIVMITSTWVKQPHPHGVRSGVIRSALASLAKHLSNELAPSKILVNQVLPGPTLTDRAKKINRQLAQRRGVDEETVRAEVLSGVPLGRYGQPEEVADLIAFLASDRGSYITGASIQVDGGQTRSVQ